MAGTLAKLMAKLGLDTSEFDRGLEKAERGATAFGGKLESGFAGRLSKMTGLGTAFLGGFAGGAVAEVVTGVIGSINGSLMETVKSIAEVGDEAKRSGLGVTEFQQWKAVAEQNRIGVDALTDGFKELSLRADEFIKTGSGSGAEYFQRLGFSAEDLAKRLKDPSQLMLELMRRLQRLDKAAQIRAFDELLGGQGGEQFVQLLSKGVGEIEETMASANVLTQHQVDKAADLDRRYTALVSTVGVFWQKMVVGAADYLSIIDSGVTLEFDPAKTAKVAGQDVADALTQQGEVTQDTLAKIESLSVEYDGLEQSAGQLVLSLSDASATLRGFGEASAAADVQGFAGEVAAAVAAFNSGTTNGDQFAATLSEILTRAETVTGSLGDLDKASMAGVIDQIAELLGNLRQLGTVAAGARSEITKLGQTDTGTPLSLSDITLPDEEGTDLAPQDSPRPKAAPAMISENVNTGSKKTARSTTRKSAADMIAEIAQQTAALNAESQALLEAAGSGEIYGDKAEYAATKAKLLTALQQEGIQITPELAAKVEAVAQAYGQAAQSTDEAREKLEALQAETERGEDALNDLFGSVLDGSDAAAKAVAELLAQIAKVQFAKGMLGLMGGTGSSISTVLGSLLGANANGTDNWSGGLTKVNERGGEIMNLPRGTQIIPHDVSMRMADAAGSASGGGASAMHVTVGFDSTGNLYVRQVAQQEAASAVAAGNQALPGRIQTINANPRRR